MKETVNHPSHYGGESNLYEAIKIIEAMGWGKAFCYGNAAKYLYRAELKGNESEDLKKAMWYIQRRIEQIEKETEAGK